MPSGSRLGVPEHGAGKGKGHDERRAHEEVRAQIRDGSSPRSSGCRKARPRRRDRSEQWPPRSPRPGGRSCRCRWCSHRRQRRIPAVRDKESRPAFSRYSVTTREPGASEVLMLLVYATGPFPRPFSRAGRRRAAPTGLEVLVQDVMAAMITSPDPISMTVLRSCIAFRKILGLLRKAVLGHRFDEQARRTCPSAGEVRCGPGDAADRQRRG